MNSTVDGSWFVGDGILLLEVLDQMMEGGCIGIFNSKVVDDESKLDGS